MTLPDDYFKRLFERSPRRLRFDPSRISNFTDWSAQVRARLAELLGVDLAASGSPRVEITGREVRDGLAREKVLIKDERFGDIPAYVVKRADLAAPAPAILCLHGHGGYFAGKDMVAGVDDTLPIAKECAEALNYGYGVQMARAGFIAFCPDGLPFGERMLGKDRWTQQHVCDAYFTALSSFGLTPMGITARGNVLAVDYLLSRPDVRGPAVGCVGLSYGGIQTLLATCLDTRIGAAVISGALFSLETTAGAGPGGQCGAQTIPGMLEWFDLPDVAISIAPRPVLCEIMKRDGCFDFKKSMEVYQRLAAAYAALGSGDRIECDVADTDHRYIGDKVVAFFGRYMSCG